MIRIEQIWKTFLNKNTKIRIEQIWKTFLNRNMKIEKGTQFNYGQSCCEVFVLMPHFHCSLGRHNKVYSSFRSTLHKKAVYEVVWKNKEREMERKRKRKEEKSGQKGMKRASSSSLFLIPSSSLHSVHLFWKERTDWIRLCSSESFVFLP